VLTPRTATTCTDPGERWFAGDHVEVWFEAAGRRSASLTFTAQQTRPGDVLVLAAEDYSGTHPGPPTPDPTT
jgi:hypothetical protein